VIDERAEQEAIAWRDRLAKDRSAETRTAFETWRAGDPRHADAYKQQARLVAAIRASGRRGVLPGRTPHDAARRWLLPSTVAGGALTMAALAAVYVVPTIQLPTPSPTPSTAAVSIGRLVKTLRLGDQVLAFIAMRTRLTPTSDARYRLETGSGRFMVLALATAFPVSILAGNYEVTTGNAVFDVSIDGDAVVVVPVNGRVSVKDRRTGGIVTLRSGEAWSSASGTSAAALPDKNISMRVDADGLRLDELIRLANAGRRPQIMLAPGIGERRLTGSVDIGDTRALARKLARTYGLLVEERVGQIRLAPGKRPQPARR
jgi:transmembrane sensor